MKNLLLKLFVLMAVLFAFSGCNGGDKNTTIVKNNGNTTYPATTASGENIGYNDKMSLKGSLRVPDDTYRVDIKQDVGIVSYSFNGAYAVKLVDGFFVEGDVVKLYTTHGSYSVVLTRKMLQDCEIW